MTLSIKQIRDLEERTPSTLRVPCADPSIGGAKGALMSWAAARGLLVPAALAQIIDDPNDDEVCGYALAGHVCMMALVVQAQIEVEQERSMKIAAAADQKPPMPEPRDPSLHFLAHACRVDDAAKPGGKRLRTTLSRSAKEILSSLEDVREKERVLEIKREEALGAFEAAKQEMIVPLVASGYVNDPRRAGRISEETSLLYFLTNNGIPLLRAIAMIGGLQNRCIPVDVDHPMRDAIYGRHEENLKTLRRVIRKSRVGSGSAKADRPLAPNGEWRQNRRHAARRTRRKR